MANRVLFVITDDQIRSEVRDLLSRCPLGTRVELKAPRRTLPQSDLMWGLLTDISRQREHLGRHYPPEIWKLIFLNAMENQTRFIPTLDGQGLFPAGRSSSDLSSTEMSELITSMIAWGDEKGVTFRQKPLPEPAR